MTVSVFAANTANALRSPRLARVLDGLLALPSTFMTLRNRKRCYINDLQSTRRRENPCHFGG